MTVALAVGEGSGFVVCLGKEMLFVEGRDDRSLELVQVFLAAGDEGRIDAVTDSLDEPGLLVPSLVMVGWQDRIRVVVGGQARPATSSTKLDTLGSPGSERWVERTLATEAGLRLTVGQATPFPLSDLRSGAVPAGSIELDLTPAAKTDLESTLEQTDIVLPVPPPDRSNSSIPLPVERSAQATQTTGEASLDHPPSLPEIPVAPSSVTEPSTPESTGQAAPVARLRFEDGRIEWLDQTVVIGRSPDVVSMPPGARAVVWEVPSISKNHVAVRPTAAGAELIDLNSRNGTHVLALAGSELVALEPGVAELVEPGTHILVGEQRFVYEIIIT